MKKIVFILCLVIVAISCGEKKDKKAISNKDVLEGTIKIDGSSTVFPVTEAVAEEFRAVQPKVKVTIGVSGTGGGFKKFSRGETNLLNASRPIKNKEKEACIENNINYLELEVAYDGLAVLVNPENDWVDNFTVEELKKIWEPAAQGVIMKWNQIRPEWPDEEIHLFGPGVASGTYDYFTEAIVGKSGSSRGDFTASEDDHVLVQGIAGDKYSLGFFGLAYYSENKDKLTLIGVNNGKEVVKPTLETVSNGTYSPLSRPLFVYVNSTSVKHPEVVEFMNFYIDNAGELAEDVGYISLPSELYVAQKEHFKAFVESNK
ncbi:PstS family phosphate ABC transporter substrate-binding protein [Lutibacter sp. A80]|uniref:PstS family phosphate ABC transporter substrate-binding protein n=1 Tax=Lutibacter sp. A80 TaxID=2918453 RepID=UPI001F0662B4|nr:PstS family phosphate ABC transporter substrate-binding protein [Lutibacter sp. A80]UMB59806.1 PstS family phosphate ABC transporter substrate-binding protein [Lutibacter sp. A80]